MAHRFMVMKRHGSCGLLMSCIGLILTLLGLLPSPAAHAQVDTSQPCSEAFVDEEVRGPGDSEVYVTCQLTLEPEDIITRRLILQGHNATGVTIDCDGATLGIGQDQDMIEVRSEKKENVDLGTIWERPENITIKHCNIIGSVRVWGMGRNGEAPDIRDSSHREELDPSPHVERVRNAAPKHIIFDTVTITGVGRNPLYFAPGVTYSSLINSEMRGRSDKVGLYLDAESAYNVIKDNYIHVDTHDDEKGEIFPFVPDRGWPLIAIDGSTENYIAENYFSSLNNGGIYLYRNCGEGGTIRVTTPSHNLIINNIFYYRKHGGPEPAVYLGSRDYGSVQRIEFGHCDDDDGKPYGSSASERDYARYNVVMQNQFYERPVIPLSLSAYIKSQNWPVNSPNYIDHNRIVTEETVVNDQPTGCYVSNGYKNFILHGETIDVFKSSTGEPVCTNYTYMCHDGYLEVLGASACNVERITFDCQVSGDNNGCNQTIGCPSGPPIRRIVGAVAACNLEYGSVTDNELSTVPVGFIQILRTSDTVSSGRCHLASTSLRHGMKELKYVIDHSAVSMGCDEHDDNGGDCHIRAALYCR